MVPRSTATPPAVAAPLHAAPLPLPAPADALPAPVPPSAVAHTPPAHPGRVSTPDTALCKSMDRVMYAAGALRSPPAPVPARLLEMTHGTDAAVLPDVADDLGEPAEWSSDEEDELPCYLQDDDNVCPAPGTQRPAGGSGADAAGFIAAVEAAAAAVVIATQGTGQQPRMHASRPSRSSAGFAAGVPSPTQQVTPFERSPTQLEHWGLSPAVLAVFRERRIASLLDWQARALGQPGVMQGRSLVYSAPTSGGKSLVADMLLVRHARASRGVLIALPFVAMCDEKVASLAPLASALGVRLHKQYGSHGGPLPGRELGIIVSTYEKANRVCTQLAEGGRMNDLGCVIVDEIHMLGDSERGSLVEFLLTKVLYASGVAASDMAARGPTRSQGTPSQGGASIQIIAMSATLPNGEQLAQWLRASHFHTSERPVPLALRIKVGDSIQDADGKAVGAPLPGGPQDDDGHVAYLCQQTLDDGGSLLVFCGTKAACSSTAQMLARRLAMPQGAQPMEADGEEEDGGDDGVLACDVVADHLQRVHDEARAGSEPGGAVQKASVSALAACARHGVAWHHSGLSVEERELVETAFRGGAVRVIVCTSTLAAGVNLPARRVIIRHDWQGLETSPLDAATFLQMSGRAGRKGLDASGECIVFAPVQSRQHPGRVERCRLLLSSTPEALTSALLHTTHGDEKLQRLMMEAVTSGLVVTEYDMERYMRCTLLSALTEEPVWMARCKAALTALVARHAITWDVQHSTWKSMEWGKAAAASGLPSAVADTCWKDLQRAAEEGVITSCDLHILFLASPVEFPFKGDWMDCVNRRLVAADSESNEVKVAARIGLNWFKRGTIPGRPPASNPTVRAIWDEKARLMARLWYALLMAEVVEERPPAVVCAHWGLEHGALTAIQERCQRMAFSVAALADAMGHTHLAKLLSHIHERIAAGTRKDIMALAVGGITAPMARLMYRKGLRTLDAVAALPGPQRLVELIMEASPHLNRSAKRAAGFRAVRILQAAREAVGDRARELQEQATEAALLAAGQGAMSTPAAPGNLQPHQLAAPLAAAPPARLPSQPAHTGAMQQPASHGMPPSAALPAPTAAVARAYEAHAAARGLVLIADNDGFEALCRRWDASPEYAFAVALTAATAGHPQGPGPRCQGLAVALPGAAAAAVFYIPFGTADTRLGDAWRPACLERLARTDGRRKLTMDVKEQIQALTARCGDPHALAAACQAALGDNLFDIRIMAWLLYPDNKDLWQTEELNTAPETILVAGGAGTVKDMRQAIEQAVAYTARGAAKQPPTEGVLAAKAAAAARLAGPQWTGAIVEAGLWAVLTQLEMPLVPVLASMERVGMPFDHAVLVGQRQAVEERLSQLVGAIRTLTGIPGLDVSSPKQVSTALFHTMGFPAPPLAATYTARGGGGDGQPKRRVHISVSKAVLLDLAHSNSSAGPIVTALLEHRELSHRLAQFEAYAACACPFWGYKAQQQQQQGGSSHRRPLALWRVHSAVYQTNAETGRLAMDRPSLHNVPHAMAFARHDAAPGDPPAQLAPRTAFAARPGTCLLVADFKQFELRMMAHFSSDAGLVELLHQGMDPFLLLAARWTSKPPGEVSAQERKWAKALSYAMLYGKGYNTLAFEMDISVAQAVRLVESFKTSMPGIEAWRDGVPKAAKGEQPMPAVRTLSGRRRQVPGLDAADREERGKAERQAVNTICQGSAADVLKRAMVALHAALAADPQRRALLVLSVHDDVVLEVDTQALPWAAALVRTVLMEAGKAAGVTVPLEVQLSTGPSWGQLSELE